MIKRLDHRKEAISRKIRVLFQASYRIEAEILKIKPEDFPPLNRTLIEFITSNSDFYGIVRENRIAALIQISIYENTIDVDSLIVHPDYFRQGLGKQLMEFVINTFDSKILTVETGLENKPATSLYEKLGFQEESQWDTEFGVRKIKYQMIKHDA